MSAHDLKFERIERWTIRAGFALASTFVMLLLRVVEILSQPDRDQTLELAISDGLMVSATGWLLLLYLKRGTFERT